MYTDNLKRNQTLILTQEQLAKRIGKLTNKNSAIFAFEFVTFFDFRRSVILHIHINHCISDNRKSNLRICTPSQNLMNGRRRSNNTSGVKGVNYIRNKNLSRPWEVRIWINGNPIRKRFSTKEEAVAQRKAWEQEYYGEFAYNEDEDVLLSKAVN